MQSDLRVCVFLSIVDFCSKRNSEDTDQTVQIHSDLGLCYSSEEALRSFLVDTSNACKNRRHGHFCLLGYLRCAVEMLVSLI